MSSKGTATSNRILDIAETLFAQHGFTAVTMKDISEKACLSRGGLYRHYNSTSQIFTAIVEREQQNAFAALNRARAGEIAPELILDVYLKHRLNSLLEKDSCIDIAITEFAVNGENGKTISKKRAKDCLNITTELITMGVENGVYNCRCVKAVAKQICFIIEGMCRHSVIIPIKQKDIDEQMRLINKMLRK